MEVVDFQTLYKLLENTNKYELTGYIRLNTDSRKNDSGLNTDSRKNDNDPTKKFENKDNKLSLNKVSNRYIKFIIDRSLSRFDEKTNRAYTIIGPRSDRAHNIRWHSHPFDCGKCAYPSV